MKKMRSLLLISAALLAACGRDRDKVADDALKNDLVLASQAQPFGAQQYTNPAELGYVFNPNTGKYEPVPAAAPAAAAPTLRSTSTVRRASSGTSRASSSGGTRIIYRDPPEPKRNTKRDAAIGAAAGAVIGATTSRDKLKGGIIGAAAGAVLGGIIGHTVDVQKP